jgi:uncharacterized protein (TIGR03083 family)
MGGVFHAGMTLTSEWLQARAALGEAVDRVTALLRTVTDTAAPALGDWNLGELAMHLSQVWLVVPGLARADLSELHELIPSVAGTAGDSVVRDIWDLGDTTVLGVQSDLERDLCVLADRIEGRAAQFVAYLDGRTPEEPRAWLVEGACVTLQMLTCHLLSETITHGYDIARAAGRPWDIAPAHAAMVLNGFIVQVLRTIDPSALVDPERAGQATATYELRIRDSATYHFVFDGGQLHVEDPSPRRVDCHISADPVALLLLMWGRRSQWQAIGRGQLRAWGRKPWLGFQLRAMIRNP